MRIGLAQQPLTSVTDTVELVARAERLGFATAWVADQTFYADPYVVLTAAAGRTTSVELGLGLTNPSTRHPAMTARAAASVDALTPGRFVLGIGAGNTQELLGPLGLLADRPATACREAVEVIRGLLTGGTVAYHGEFVRCQGVTLEIDQRPPVPIVIGGRGRRMLQLAGQQADGVILSLAALDRSWGLVAESAVDAGRDPRTIRRIAWGECIVDPSPEEIERQRHTLAHVLGRAPVPGLRMLGLEPDFIDAVKAAYQLDGIPGAARHISAELLARHTVIGTADECLERLDRLARSGVDDFAALVKLPTAAERRDYLDRLAERVLVALP